jgi:5-methylcytosine-specific restriction protein A
VGVIMKNINEKVNNNYNILKKIVGEKQKKIDELYPNENRTDYGVTVQRWRVCLGMPKVILDDEFALMKRIYLSENHLIKLSDLEQRDGVEKSTYLFKLIQFAIRLSNKLEMEEISALNNNDLWTILFWGKRIGKEDFEFKIKPALAIAMEALYPELLIETGDKLDENRLVRDLGKTIFDNTETSFEYNETTRAKEKPILIDGHLAYKRDNQVAKNAIIHAKYLCETDSLHNTFVRLDSRQGYFETQHLVPMKYSDKFKVSLDVEENILCLCSNCKKQLQYGLGINVMLKQFYEQRKEYLKKVGIIVTYEELLDMYDVKIRDCSNSEDVTLLDYSYEKANRS